MTQPGRIIVRQVRSAIGPDIGLMVDTNCAWDEAQAIAAARSMRDLDLMMIEEPVFPPEDFAALARVREAGGMLATPQGPGLGLDPDPGVIELYRVNP